MADYQLLVDPLYTQRLPGMVALSCSNPAVELVVETPVAEVIKKTELLRTYPNPFNPTATVAFTLKNPGMVRLSIYDIRGRLVKDLRHGPMESGRYEIPWRGRDVFTAAG